LPELAALNQPVEITPAPGVEEHAPLTRQPVIFNTADLGALLAAENTAQTSQYVIQLGVFESEEAAHRMVAAINSVGFEGSVVKTQQGPQERFRVQQGPFASRELAKMTQQRMQKRGIISIIRKIA
jgi:cell division protein FtsN